MGSDNLANRLKMFSGGIRRMVFVVLECGYDGGVSSLAVHGEAVSGEAFDLRRGQALNNRNTNWKNPTIINRSACITSEIQCTACCIQLVVHSMRGVQVAIAWAPWQIYSCPASFIALKR